ncbi:spermidine hydroxycinnamoyl transferase [Cajanus cajan]|uniref:spermidine hydroxycinnamoyl transferase n=1 Tax=Cajanus cajan TaxID=3821 RepID=UPI00098DACCB|nr:spermidine hydroxycinnamoyl transferase [Cajanus cajan]
MLTIVASYCVVPNEETPETRLRLSDYDQVVRLGHTPTIYVYKAKHNHNTTEKMRKSLSKILVFYYPIAGRLSLTESGRIELDCNAKGVTFLEAETTKSMADYGDFAPSESIKELVPKIDYTTQPIEELPLLFVQLTRFHGGEGFAIGSANSHVLSDGLAHIRFMNSWAKVTRGETLEPHEMPSLDRTALIFQRSPSSPRFDHPELKPLPLKLGASDNAAEKKKKTSAVLLKLTAKQVEKLKKKANEQPVKEGSRHYSRFEAITAHIWRCASKARELDEKQPTLLRFNVDIRNRLIPPLPRNYFGNALVATVTPKCYAGEIMSKPLSYAAQKVREANEMVSNEYIRSQSEAVLGQEHLDCIKAFFMGQGERSLAHFPGNPNIQITSWMNLPVYEADFGWGKPIYFGLGYVNSHDRALILLSPEGDGSVIVSIHFQIAHMQLFKKLFYEDYSKL